MFSKNILIGLILAVCLAEYSSAIQCYHCDTVNDESCGDETFNLEKAKHKMDCSSLNAPDWAAGFVSKLTDAFLKPSGCSKLTTTLKGKSSVVRSCYWGNPSDTADTCFDTKKYSSDVKTECSVCTTDLCNGATTSTTTYGIAVLITALFGRFLF